MQWLNGVTREVKIHRREKWHKWFAWRPITVYRINNEHKFKVWLEVIERKGDYNNWPWCKPYWEYEYRLPQ